MISSSRFPLSTLPRIAGAFSASMGLFVLVGWVWNISWIKSVLPGAVEMKANTAMALLLAGVGLWLLTAPGSRHRTWLGQALGLIVAAIGLATAAEYAFNWSLGIDELLFRDTATTFNIIHGRMSPYTAIVFASSGLGLATLPRPALRWLVWLAGMLSLFIGGLTMIGYLWEANELVTDRFVPPVAINTGVAFLALGLGLIFASIGRAPPTRQNSVPLSPVERKVLAGFVLAVVLLLVTGGLTYRAMVAAAESAGMVAHTQQVRASLSRLHAATSDAEAQQRNYLLSGLPQLHRAFEDRIAETARQITLLARLVADNPVQSQRLTELRAVLDERIMLLRRTAGIYEQSGLAAAQELIHRGEGRRLTAVIRARIEQMGAMEDALLIDREAAGLRDKEIMLLLLLMTLVVAAMGFLALFRAIRKEMTSRARAEDALRHSEESLAVTMRSIGDAMLATDTAGCITRMNGVAELLTGWTEAEARGRPITEIFHILQETTGKPAVIPVEQVLATGEIHGLANHTILRARDGTERPIADSAAPIRDREGRVLGVVLVFRDVMVERAAERALRESEARYRTLFESIDEGFCIIGMIFDAEGRPEDYRFLEINPSFEKQTGLANALGKRMRELAPQHEKHWFEIYGRIALTGESLRFQNRAEQLRRTYDVYAFRFGDPAARQVAILFNDITAARESEERVARLNAQLQARTVELEAVNRELESFSYSVSHDLRAPLRHVQGYVGMLAHEMPTGLTEKAKRYLDTITAAGTRMGQLIDDLLEFSRMGRVEIRQASVDLNALVLEVRQGLESMTRDRDIRWTIASLPRVHGDVAMLRQVFANLLGNAVKYTRGRQLAEIEIGGAGEETGRLVIYVRDNGAGFDMKYVDKLFTVFQRLHGADEFEGTGVGLASVRRIITRHGGRTWAEGRVGAGATFYFTLAPAEPSSTGEPARPAG